MNLGSCMGTGQGYVGGVEDGKPDEDHILGWKAARLQPVAAVIADRA